MIQKIILIDQKSRTSKFISQGDAFRYRFFIYKQLRVFFMDKLNHLFCYFWYTNALGNGVFMYSWKFMFLLKIYNSILTAPDRMFFITLLLHLKINVVTWNNMNKNNIPSQLTFTCSKSTIETLVFSHLFLVFLLLTLIK